MYSYLPVSLQGRLEEIWMKWASLTMFRPPCWCTTEVSILSVVNLCKIFRRISKVLYWGKRKDLQLGEMSSLSISYNITISWLNPLNGFQTTFFTVQPNCDVLIVPWIGYSRRIVFPDFTQTLNIGHLRFLELSNCRVADLLFNQLPSKCPLLIFFLLQDCHEITKEAYINSHFKTQV